MQQVTKSYPVFDCDSHVTELPAIWDYLSKPETEVVRRWYWPSGNDLILNGNRVTFGIWASGRRPGASYGFPAGGARRFPSAAEVAGPGVNKKIIRKLRSMGLSEEQVVYLNHKGAREPRARVSDMDLMGIDQVVVIPVHMFAPFLFVENLEAAALMARAYNDWIYDWCAVAPQRLFPAAVLPVHNAELAALELRRVAKRGFRLAMVRPVDVQGRYPNQLATEPMWRAFEETDLVVAMHSLAAGAGRELFAPRQWSPGAFVHRAINPRQMGDPSQSLSFPHEAIIWVTNVVLSGFLEAHPGITRMAIMESNATWLPALLETCDRAIHLYKNERKRTVTRLPSEIFRERCFIAFEGDETPVYRQCSVFEDIGIWSSDVYHHDAADAWTAIREMEKLKVPAAAQAKLMGGNARRMYRIEPKVFTTTEPESYPRPDWYPKMEDTEQEFAQRMVKA